MADPDRWGVGRVGKIGRCSYPLYNFYMPYMLVTNVGFSRRRLARQPILPTLPTPWLPTHHNRSTGLTIRRGESDGRHLPARSERGFQLRYGRTRERRVVSRPRTKPSVDDAEAIKRLCECLVKGMSLRRACEKARRSVPDLSLHQNGGGRGVLCNYRAREGGATDCFD